jgi:hypothetical protein
MNYASDNGNKYPRLLFPNVYSFAPNRDTLGGTAYFLIHPEGNILIDCPWWEDPNTINFLRAQGGVRWLYVTNRSAIGKRIPQWQAELGFTVVIQEQEAYLLPEAEVKSFSQELPLARGLTGIWCCGFSPGTSCLHYQSEEGGLLFSGRHLLPDVQGKLSLIKTAKTFHWPRQQQSLVKLRDRFDRSSLTHIFPGANTGFLRGQGFYQDGYPHLEQIPIT